MAGDNKIGRLSIKHLAQFADLRALADGEAQFFQSALAVGDANARRGVRQTPRRNQ
jgi:hypothetical protein